MNYYVKYLVIAAFVLVLAACGSNERRNGAAYNPDGIELVYVEGIKNDSLTIEGFYIGKFEVTQDQWQKIMGNNPSDFKGAGNLPVESINWHDVQDYITRLNSATGKNYRLPTDVEWEFAASGGTAEKFCQGGCDYSGGNDLDKIAWYKSNSGERTQQVGTKAPNELGIHDMTGNVWEWCGNVIIFNRPPDADGNPQPSIERIATRGGSWGSDVPRRLHVANRSGDAPEYKSHYIGFRVVLP